MVVRVAERARAPAPAAWWWRPTAQRIVAACAAHGVEARADARRPRLAAATAWPKPARCSAWRTTTIVVNVQGDEPLIDARADRRGGAAAGGAPARPAMSTAAHAIDSLEEFTNPNVVKVVLDAHGMRALLQPRADSVVARWLRGKRHRSPARAAPPLRHIGIYGYRAGFLRAVSRAAAGAGRTTEALEQLRALWHGHRIAVHVSAHAPGPGIDTPEDLARVRALFAAPSCRLSRPMPGSACYPRSNPPCGVATGRRMARPKFKNLRGHP